MKKKELLLNCDFLFEPQMKGVYFHFINVEFNFINVRNDNDSSFVIFRYYKINSIMKYEAKETYLVNLKNYSLIAKSSRKKKPMLLNS